MASLLNFHEFTLAELEEWCVSEGLPRFRARQLLSQVSGKGVVDFTEMTELSKGLRTHLAEIWNLAPLEERKRMVSREDQATKLLWGLPDGKEIEGVFMAADYRETLCFSTQVGCAFNCSFCITARMGKIRNLTAGEIVAQVHRMVHTMQEGNRAVNLVAMGMGEPLDNTDALLKAVSILGEPLGMNISPRRITISTVGVVPGILRLAEEKPELKLALSLNATTDKVREKLMPVTRKYPIEKLIPALKTYAEKSKHRITLEYVLIRGLNDTPGDAARLGKIAEMFPSKVNVIPFNESELFPDQRPDRDAVDAFAKSLWKMRTTVTVRYSKGVDILAACGQLGYDQVKEKEKAEKAKEKEKTA
jgi:23S rRNA (adenine2503-C2)-methyltransferase